MLHRRPTSRRIILFPFITPRLRLHTIPHRRIALPRRPTKAEAGTAAIIADAARLAILSFPHAIFPYLRAIHCQILPPLRHFRAASRSCQAVPDNDRKATVIVLEEPVCVHRPILLIP
jgi:hypothetical protein